MTANLKPYPTYKDSGIPWIGHVPEHWVVVPNRALLKLAKELVGERSDEYTLLSLTKQGIIIRNLENAEGKFPASFDTYQAVEPGDLIFCLFDIDETPRTVGLSEFYGMVTGAYTRFVCGDDTARRFLYLLYLSLDNGKMLKPLYSGLRKVITKNRFLNAKIALPPSVEQTAIVRYLDHADSRIQSYISAKERLIELLTEQKQAIINKAVTRGLDPNVPLRPSGVEWLGDVPAHWEIARFSRQISIAEGQVDPTVEPYASMPLIAPNHLEARTGRLLHQETASEQGAISSKNLCRAGDVIYSKIRPALAKVVVAPSDCLCSADMYPLSPGHSLQANYLFWLLLSEAFTAWSVLESDRVAMPKINRATLNSYHIPIPPLHEQAAIVRHLDEAVTKIYTATDSTRRQIELMQEYRTRLIADVVTGKLDVRGAVADEIEMPTP